MTRLFLDTNIVVDVLERREPFCHDAVRWLTRGQTPCEVYSLEQLISNQKKLGI